MSQMGLLRVLLPYKSLEGLQHLIIIIKQIKIVGLFIKLRENPMAIVVSAFAAFGGFLYGYDTGTISGIIDMPFFLEKYGYLQNNGTATYALRSSDKSLIVSILSAGTFVGALLGYPSSDFLGRR
ncbi:unnamed protein product, partial [Adineta ricciae]